MNRINIICLGVRDMEKSLAFYRNIRFKTYVKDNNPPIVFFDNQGTKLELYPIEGLAKDINAENPPMVNPGGFSGITLACNMKSEKEVDDCMALIEKHGGEIVKKPEKVFWDGYSGYFRDPRRILLGSCLRLLVGVRRKGNACDKTIEINQHGM